MRVHFLTAGFSTANGRAMLFPLICHGRRLRDAGISLRFYDRPEEALTACDVLVLDCKAFGNRWITERSRVEDELAALARKTRVVYFDITDSTALEHPGALPFVDAYWKNQVLADLPSYGERYYGARLFTDFYHRHFGAVDDAETWSEPVVDPHQRAKIRLAWNSALSDYGFSGLYRIELYRLLSLRPLLRFPKPAATPEVARPVAVAVRMTTNYSRASVAFQRRKIHSNLARWMPSGRLGRRAFFRELRQSKIVVSPFGWGEIAYRDYEAMLSGALLVKPDMGHMRTWPDLYVDQETMAAFPWSMDGLETLLLELLADDERRIGIAQRAQETYRRHTSGPDAPALFVERLSGLLSSALSARS